MKAQIYRSGNLLLAVAVSSLISFSSNVLANNGISYTPDSSIEKPENVGTGRAAHTHAKFLLPNGSSDGSFSSAVANAAGAIKPATTVGTAPFTGYGYQTPASISCIYGLVAASNSCNPNKVTKSITGGSKAIAIVDAYDYPKAASDLAAFSKQFGLPTASFSVVYASGTKPAPSPNAWELEEAMDIQWAHAMAPSAKIYLVEAASSSLQDLITAINVASSLVSAAGGGQVSMSWGTSDFIGEGNFDYLFTTPNVEYFASSGDSAGVNWPCVSQNVVCVGGTTIRVDTTGNFLQSVAWTDTGGGFSLYVTAPAYQTNNTTGYRGVPDIAFIADPTTGGWIYYTPSSGPGAGWWVVGGTSLSSPIAAGITNTAKDFQSSSYSLLNSLYNNPGYFTDVTAGWCGPSNAYLAGPGWDECTGFGSYYGLP